MVRWSGYTRLNDGTGNPAPSATITVFNKGQQTKPFLYAADDATQPKANPFTAGTDGFLFFYAANGRYDVSVQGGGIANPYTWADVLLYDPGTVGS